MNGDKFISEKNFYIDERISNHQWDMRNFHYHNSFEIYYLVSGNRKMLVQDKVYELCPSDIVLLRPNILHRSMNSGVHSRINIVFDNLFLDNYFTKSASEYLTSCFDTEFIKLNNNENQQFLKIFSEIKNKYNSHLPCFVSLAKILELFINAKKRQETEFSTRIFLSNTSEKITSVIEYISKNYNIISSIDEIARYCYINKSYLCRLFKKETGLTVFEYLNLVKIYRSCELICNTNDTIADIAIKCGFSSISYFSYTFKKLIGKTPLQFKKYNSAD